MKFCAVINDSAEHMTQLEKKLFLKRTDRAYQLSPNRYLRSYGRSTSRKLSYHSNQRKLHMKKKGSVAIPHVPKEKRCGRINGRGCADDRKQRVYISKEDRSSPTVTTEEMMILCIMGAMKGRDVATVDITGVFLPADMDDIFDMRLDGAMAELLVKVDPKTYSKHLVLENGKKILYVRLKKALYGTLKASLLFWKHLTGKQQEWGFVLNPYDTCVANKTTDGKQCTILWPVDYLKISHVEPEVVDEIIELLHTEYGKDK